MFLSIALLVALAIAPAPSSSEFSIDDSALFRINFRDTLKETADETVAEEEGERRKVTMMSSNSERYECTLPKIADTSGSEDEVIACDIRCRETPNKCKYAFRCSLGLHGADGT